MARTLVTTIGALALWAAVQAAPALAADQVDAHKQMIREEIEAYWKDQKSDFRVYWKEGLKFETRDKNVKMAIGGRIQLDLDFYADSDDRGAFNAIVEADDGDPFRSGVEFRRVYLEFEGEIYHYTVFKVQFDFAPAEDVEFKDVYVGWNNLKKCWGCWVPDVYVGHFKEYFSLEALTSDSYLTFLERALPVEAFAPQRNIGVGLTQCLYGERLTYGVGWFADTPSLGNAVKYFDEEGQRVTGRVTLLPWAPCDCETRFWHVGAAVSYQFDDPNGYRYRTRPECHIGDYVVDVTVADARSAWLLGAETAFVWDRWKVQAEYMAALVDVEIGDDPMFWGYYVYGAYLLNGKGRTLRRCTATFDKNRPCKNFDCTQCSWGAWELAVRYSFIDLDDANYNGGKASDVTVGLNWYLNPNARVQFNYVWSDVTDFQGNAGVDGTLNIFAIRLAVFW